MRLAGWALVGGAAWLVLFAATGLWWRAGMGPGMAYLAGGLGLAAALVCYDLGPDMASRRHAAGAGVLLVLAVAAIVASYALGCDLPDMPWSCLGD